MNGSPTMNAEVDPHACCFETDMVTEEEFRMPGSVTHICMPIQRLLGYSGKGLRQPHSAT